MNLKNLNTIANNSKKAFQGYDQQEVILSDDFKKLYEELHHSNNSETIVFSKYTTLVKTSSGLTITFPNQWFYIASYFVNFLVALKEYKNTYNLVFNKESNSKELIKNIKENGVIPNNIIQKIQSVLTETEDIKFFQTFLTNYDWWYGSKTIDRGDYFVSPILNLAKVVNVTQTYIADIAYKLSTDPTLLIELKKSTLVGTRIGLKSTTEINIHKEKTLRDFAKYVFTYFYGKVWPEVLTQTNQKKSQINGTNFISHDYETFKRLIAQFDSQQTKDSLTSANTIRYFEDPIFVNNSKYYYFTTQWSGVGDYNLTFSNLKNYFEEKFPNYIIRNEDESYLLIELGEVTEGPFDKSLFINNLEKSGLIYSKYLISRFVASLFTKPFVILTGLSGSGKTKLAQAFVQWICKDESQYLIIPVGADWTNREPLLGYPNALNPGEYVKPDNGVLDLILQANNNEDLPYFLILDEMNLSHVERYFSDFLSVMESKDTIPLYSEDLAIRGLPSNLTLPPNLFIIGTVNIDETTNMFSPKVLDRANTIEFRVTEKEMEGFLADIKEINMDSLYSKGAGMAKSFLEMSEKKSFATEAVEDINKTLLQFFGELKKTGAEFGYRSATEILRLINQLTLVDNTLTINQKLDIAIMQKLLPKLHGSHRKLCPVLSILGSFCVNEDIKIEKEVFGKEDFDYKDSKVLFPLSLEKISRMYRGAIDNGFTSFAEA